MNDFQTICDDLKSPNLKVRKQALTKLGKLPPSKESILLCEAVASNDPSSGLKYVARCISDFWKENATKNSLPFSKLFPNGKFSVTAAEKAFSGAGEGVKLDLLKFIAANDLTTENDSILGFVMNCLESETDFTVITFLVRIAGSLGDTATISFIQPFLTHESSRVRAGAIECLAAIGDDIMWSLIIPLLGDNELRVYTQASKSLLAFDEGEAQKLIEKLANSKGVADRKKASNFLSVTSCSWADKLMFVMNENESPGEQSDNSSSGENLSQSKFIYTKVAAPVIKSRSYVLPIAFLCIFIAGTAIILLKSGKDVGTVTVAARTLAPTDDSGPSVSTRNKGGRIKKLTSKRQEEREARRRAGKRRLSVFAATTKEERVVIAKRKRITGKRKERSW